MGEERNKTGITYRRHGYVHKKYYGMPGLGTNTKKNYRIFAKRATRITEFSNSVAYKAKIQYSYIC